MYVLSWWDADKENEKERVDDCSSTVLLCVKRTRALCTSSAAVSIPSFFPSLALSASLSICSLVGLLRFSSLCSATHSTVRRTQRQNEKKNRNVDAVGQVSLITSSPLFSSYASNRTEDIFLCSTVFSLALSLSPSSISDCERCLYRTMDPTDPFCSFFFTSSTNYLHLLCSHPLLRMSFPHSNRSVDQKVDYEIDPCLHALVSLQRQDAGTILPFQWHSSDKNTQHQQQQQQQTRKDKLVWTITILI